MTPHTKRGRARQTRSVNIGDCLARGASLEATSLLKKTRAAKRTVYDGAPVSILSGPIADQSALHGALAKIRDLGRGQEKSE